MAQLPAIDVAFSFLAQDETLAISLAGKLRSRLRTFVYSEVQKDLAGKDGVEEFTSMYGDRASLVAVLYRTGYGQTKWTRLEQSAITSRGVEHGWHSIVVISLDGSRPTWIPASRLWLGYDKFGPDTVAEVLVERHAELGVLAHPETIAGRAQSLGSSRAAAENARRLTHSDEGVKLASSELAHLSAELNRHAEEISSGTSALDARVSIPNQGVWRFDLEGHFLTFGWALQYSNTLEGASLLVREGVRPRSPVNWMPPVSSTKTEFLYAPEIEPTTTRAHWRLDRPKGTLLSTEALVEYHLRRLLDAIARH